MNRSGGHPAATSVLKRALDVILSALGLVAILPLLICLSLAIRMVLGKPILFRQWRPGLSARPFEILKFRTMNEARGADGERLPDATRLTPFGRFLRRTSLDELPTLWNVLKGEMSLVGPRPLLTQYLDRYSPEQARRHEVRPGITGWAQVNGRNALDWEDKLALDVWYVDHWSLGLDSRILLRTIAIVSKRRGIGHGSEETMPEFRGSSEANR